MVLDNIKKLKARIAVVCAKADRRPEDIIIVAVAKGASIELIRQALAAGINDIGENRIQEAFPKYSSLKAGGSQWKAINWHMVGHLQTNKVKDAVAIFSLIQSVDSIKLAGCINQAACRINKIQDILIEVNTSGEPAKFGLAPPSLAKTIKEISQFKNLNIIGLMTVAPIVENCEKARHYFKILRELKDEINKSFSPQLSLLSMGMSGDFEVAIEEGANVIRIGRAIFQG